MRLISEIEQNLVGGGDDPYANSTISNGPGGNGWEGSSSMDAMGGAPMQTVVVYGQKEGGSPADGAGLGGVAGGLFGLGSALTGGAGLVEVGVAVAVGTVGGAALGVVAVVAGAYIVGQYISAKNN